VAGLPGSGLTRRERLSSPGQFRRVFQKGIRFDGPLFSLVAAPNDCGHDRLGLTASRRVGGAVVRNRAKRQLRECFRRHKRTEAPALDLVLMAKNEIVGCVQGEVEREYQQRLRRLRDRVARTGGAAPAPAD
jgi:ribonuclease P protein component